VLIDFEVLVIMIQSSLIGPLGLSKVFVFFIKKSNLEKGINLSFHSEGVGEDGVLEVADSLVDLVGLRKDHS